VKDKKSQAVFRLNGLYIGDDNLFYQIEIKNRSNISYDKDMFRFFIRDKKKSKRTASQEIEMQP
jgi:hypothetical protein